MLTNQKKHNAAKFLERDEEITQAKLLAHLQAEDDLLAQHFVLTLCFISITLWLIMIIYRIVG